MRNVSKRSKFSHPPRFKRHSLVYYYESRTMQKGNRRICPGVVQQVGKDGYCLIKYRYSATDSGLTATVQVRMDSRLLSERRQGPKFNTMLNNNIFGHQFNAQKYQHHTWYDLHLVSVKAQLEKEEKDQHDRMAKEKEEKRRQAKLMQVHSCWTRVSLALRMKRRKCVLEVILLEKMKDVAKQMQICKRLAARIPSIDSLPLCVLIPKKLHEDSKRHENILVLQPESQSSWGTVSKFQREAFQQYKNVMATAGQLVRNIHHQQCRAHRHALLSIKRAGMAEEYTQDEWKDMEKDVLALNITTEYVSQMAHPSQSSSAAERNGNKLFVLTNLLRRYTSEIYKEPLAGMLTIRLIYGGMERKRIPELNEDFSLFMEPKLLDMKRDPDVETARRYGLPDIIIFGGNKESKLRASKNMHDNYGKAIADGKRADGCTGAVINIHDEDLPEELVEALNVASPKEIPISQAAVESVEDILPSLKDDGISLLHFTHLLADAHSQINIVGNATSTKQLKLHSEYMAYRIKKFEINQQARASRHDKVDVVEEELVSSNFTPSPFWDSWQDELLEGSSGSSVPTGCVKQWWDCLAFPVHWGFELYGNNTMRFLIDRFVHAVNSNGDRVFACPDDSVMKVNVGDGAPAYRQLRCEKGHRRFVANGGDPIPWEAPAAARGPGGDPENIVEWTDNDNKTRSTGVGARLFYIGFPETQTTLMEDGDEPGMLQVTIDGGDTVQLSASHFVPWSPKVGDEFDFSNAYYQDVIQGTGHFHMLAAALKRSIERNTSAWTRLVQQPGWRRTENAANYLLGAGDFKKTLKECSSGMVGIMIFIIEVYKSIYPNGSLPEMLEWVNKVRVDSAAWNQIVDMTEDMSDILMYRNSNRTSNMEGVDVSIRLFCELFAQTGATQYSQFCRERKISF